MLIPLVPIRLHGWLDEFATLSYLGSALFLGFQGAAFWLLLVAAAFHFANTRLTDYPQGQLKVYSLATHAKLELVEGLFVLGATFALPTQTTDQWVTLTVLGASQLAAALAGDTRMPATCARQAT